MDGKEYKEIYEKYGERMYSQNTVKSVQRCYISHENRKQAIVDSSKERRITKKQAIYDISDFFNCIKRCYSGYDYFFQDELCDIMQKTLIQKIRKRQGSISNQEFCYLLYKTLHNLINDSHFEIHVCGKSWRFFRKYIAYVTDIILKKVECGYEVIRKNSFFDRGYIFEEKEVQNYLIPTMYVSNDVSIKDTCYLLGKYTTEEVKEIVLAGKKVNLHKILSDTARQDTNERIIQKKDYVIVNHKTYSMPWNETLLEEFYQDGVNCSKWNHVILNLVGNEGGSSDYPERFYEGLAGIEDTNFLGAYLPFPENIQDGMKKYELHYPNCTVETKRSFQGTIYVVMNKGTASSAEMAVSLAHSIKNAIIVGSGSSGCTNFGNCMLYQLPYSKILFCYGNRVFHHEKFNEGKGFLPDFWIDDVDPVRVVEQFLEKKMSVV